MILVVIVTLTALGCVYLGIRLERHRTATWLNKSLEGDQSKVALSPTMREMVKYDASWALRTMRSRALADARRFVRSGKWNTPPKRYM